MQNKYDSFGWDFNKNLNLKTFCPKPFNSLTIDTYGDVYACICQSWLPIRLGTAYEFTSLTQALTNNIATELQASITNGSYRYCDVKTCGFSDNGKTSIPEIKPKTVVFAMDDSCNYTCPSCREEFRFLHKGKDYEERMKLASHVGKLISECDDKLELVFGDGEVFASTIYRQLLSTIDTNKHTFKLQTNGSLIKENWSLVKRFETNIAHIHISVDAGTAETYHKVRRGGQWNKLYSNLHWLVDYTKQEQLNINIQLSFCLQSSNCMDIIAFSDLCTELNVAGEIYPIADWGTWHNFDEHAVWKSSHSLHSDMITQLQQVRDNKLLKIHGSL